MQNQEYSTTTDAVGQPCIAEMLRGKMQGKNHSELCSLNSEFKTERLAGETFWTYYLTAVMSNGRPSEERTRWLEIAVKINPPLCAT